MFLMILVLFKKLLKIDNQLGTFVWRIPGFQETSFKEAKLVSRTTHQVVGQLWQLASFIDWWVA